MAHWKSDTRTYNDNARTNRINNICGRFGFSHSFVMRAIDLSESNSWHFFKEYRSHFTPHQRALILAAFNDELKKRGKSPVRVEYMELCDDYMTEADIKSRFSPLLNYAESLGLVVTPRLYFVGSRRDVYTAYFDITRSISDSVEPDHLCNVYRRPSKNVYSDLISSCAALGSYEPLYARLWADFAVVADESDYEYDARPFLADIRAALPASGRSAVACEQQHLIQLKSDPCGRLAVPSLNVIVNALASSPAAADLYSLLPSAGLVAVLCDVSYQGLSKGIYTVSECVRFYSALNDRLAAFLRDTMAADTVYNFFQRGNV